MYMALYKSHGKPRKAMKTLRASFFQSHFSKVDQNKNSTFFIAALVLVEGALRRKQLTASFVEHFRKNYENTICVYFQFS